MINLGSCHVWLPSYHNQGNLKSTRKARLSPFLSLYFWLKPIRLQQGGMRGSWSQILSFPSHSPWFYTAAALQRKNLGEGERWKQIRLQQPSAGIQCYCNSIKKSNNMTITTPLNSNSDCCNLICDHLSPSPRLGPCARFVTSTAKFEMGSPWFFWETLGKMQSKDLKNCYGRWLPFFSD